jgi:beta-glucanase (GH16 family)
MNRLTNLFLSAFGGLIVLTSLPAVAQPPERSGYDVAWYDEFDGTSLDTNLWNVSNTNNTTNNSQQDYLPSQISVSGGSLRILSENIPSRGRPYRSGLVESKSYQREGRWDVRAKLPATTGMWPAIWLLANTTTSPWPSGGEIDIMENRGDEPFDVSSAFHFGENGGGVFRHEFVYSGQTAVHDGVQQNYHDGFHIYSVEWDSDQLRYYVDDVHHWTVRDYNVENFISNETAPMRLILNTAIGGDFLTNPNGSTVWPQVFEIDYVHVYTKSYGGTTLTFDNGGFEDNGGSLASWTKFGDAIDNVSSNNQHIRSGDEAMKLYGQFNGNENFSGVSQGISVTAGDELTVTANAFVASNDSIAGTGNYAVLKFDYFSKQYGEFGSGDYIGSDSVLLADGTTANDVWLTRQLNSTAPAGAVEARVAIVFGQPLYDGGAVFVDDVTFVNASDTVLLGDVNLDGMVDFSDISAFIALLMSGGYQAEADINEDGFVNFGDIPPFIAILMGN